ncbi:helix-turn-helix domain-containing protein [Streptomyces sp. NPDC088350]|uniref:helix-turn-helix domain-containing protein n=1 Tax=Streptomyces sp. NPDC088350 TaxID=3365854 RepID=UPI0038001A8F
MDGSGAAADRWSGTFSLDSTRPDTATEGFDDFQRGWETQIGDVFPLPAYSPATIGDFRVKGRFDRVRGAVIGDLHVASPTVGTAAPGGDIDHIGLYMVRRGAWEVSGLPDLDRHTVPAGQFLLRDFGRPLPFEIEPHSTTHFLFLPSAMLRPLLRDRSFLGSVDSAEARLLMSHIAMVRRTSADLSPAGSYAAYQALLELAKAVAMGRFDDVEPQLAPALAQAAKDLANSHLAEPELSPMMLARELNVSVSTLQRAFAAAGESVAAYIRGRRLEEARLALGAPHGRLSVSEIAAHWQFADSSHFIRAFKKRYGQTPTEYARTTGRAGN